MFTQHSDPSSSCLETSLDQDFLPIGDTPSPHGHEVLHKLGRPLWRPATESMGMNTPTLASSNATTGHASIPAASEARSMGLVSPTRSRAAGSPPNALDRQYMSALSISYEAGMYGFEGFLSDNLADTVTYAYFRRHLEGVRLSW